MINSMEAVATNVMFFIELVGYGIEEGFFWYGSIECCVENGVVDGFGKGFLGCSESAEIDGIVKWRERSERRDVFDYFGSNKSCFCVVFSSMDDAMSNFCYFFIALDQLFLFKFFKN